MRFQQRNLKAEEGKLRSAEKRNTRTWKAGEVLKDQRVRALQSTGHKPLWPKRLVCLGAVSGGEKRKCPLWLIKANSFIPDFLSTYEQSQANI